MKNLSHKALMAFFLLLPFSLCAQRTNVVIYGNLKDIATKRYIKDAIIEIMTPDSTVVGMGASGDYGYARINGVKANSGGGLQGEINADKLILKISHPEYATLFYDMKLKGQRENVFFYGDILLRRDNFLLDEITVSATKIRMVMGKDTVVFNASEFQLAQGSMLDELIRQLPGVQLDGSRITVNGRFVSSLLVNGEDFFKGDPSVALQNLPAYMVNKVKVYERTPDHAYITGIDSLKEYPLVMDVRLKREYAKGWIANAEAAYGTNDRYMGRVFGMRFSDVSRFAIFGNFNNTNDTREPGSSGNWDPSWQASGLTDMQYGGANLLLRDLDEEWKLTSNVKLIHEDIENSTIGAGSYFLEAGNAYWRNKNTQRTDRFKVISGHELQLKQKEWYATINPFVEYAEGSNRIEQLYASFTSNPTDSYRGATIDSLFAGIGSQQLEESLVNRVANKGEGWDKNLLAKFDASTVIQIPHTPDYVHIGIDGKLNKRNGENFNHYDLQYGKNANENNVFHNRYEVSPSLDYNIGGVAYYFYKNNKKNQLIVQPVYTYRHKYSSGNYNLYRLDRFSGWDNNNHLLGALPSTTDSLQQSLDYQNSYNSVASSNVHDMELAISQYFTLWGKRQMIKVLPSVRIQTDLLDYTRAELDTTVRRRTIAFEPYFLYSFDNFELSYFINNSEPSLVRMLDVVDDKNPLVIRYGNPNLKQIRHHNIHLKREWRKKEMARNIRLEADYNLYQNAVAEAMTYDPAMGVSSYRPENINGNWNTKAKIHFTQALDEKQSLFITTNTDGSFVNSVDYLSLTGATTSTRSEVRSFTLNENLSLNYKWKNHSIGFRGDARWTHATSPRNDFTTINVADFNYGLNAQLTLPWNCSLSTDLTMYSRRGYEDRAMNTNDLVWNARLTNASLMRGNLIFMLDGFDILGQLSTVRRTLNAQGRTETWYNTVPRYAMLHVVYRLNREPKRK